MTTQENILSGTLDPNFNGNGMLTIDYGDSDMGDIYIRQIKTKETGPNQGIYFAGFAHHFYNRTAITVGRLDFDGKPDLSFGPTENGLVQIRFPNDIEATVMSFAIQSDGNIIIEAIDNNYNNTLSCFARFKPDGSLDSDFGQYGFAIIPLERYGTPLPLPEDSNNTPRQSAGGLMGMELLPEGSILACHPSGVILRLTSDGKMDKSFNKEGFLKVAHPDYPEARIEISGVMRRDDGKYVAAGTIVASPNKAIFVCCDTTGTIDTSFGSDGNGFVVIEGTPEHQGIGLDLLAKQPNQRLLGIGSDFAFPFESGLLISRESNGKPNIQFNKGEPVYTRLNDEKMRTIWMGAAFQEKDGKTVVAGALGTPDLENFWIVIARFNANGEMDTTFGAEQGWVKKRMQTQGGGYATNVTLQGDGKILVCAIPTTLRGVEDKNARILRFFY